MSRYLSQMHLCEPRWASTESETANRDWRFSLRIVIRAGWASEACLPGWASSLRCDFLCYRMLRRFVEIGSLKGDDNGIEAICSISSFFFIHMSCKGTLVILSRQLSSLSRVSDLRLLVDIGTFARYR